jgi:hypothetical protein
MSETRFEFRITPLVFLVTTLHREWEFLAFLMNLLQVSDYSSK